MKSNKDTGVRENNGMEWGLPFCTEHKKMGKPAAAQIFVYKEDTKIKRYTMLMYNSNTKEWLTNHFSHELQAAK